MTRPVTPITTERGDAEGRPLERVRHLKRGTEYEVLGEAEAQVSYDRIGAAHRVGRPLWDESRLTVYRCVKTGKLWCRFTDEMRDGRFEALPAAPSHPGEADRVGLGELAARFEAKREECLRKAVEAEGSGITASGVVYWVGRARSFLEALDMARAGAGQTFEESLRGPGAWSFERYERGPLSNLTSWVPRVSRDRPLMPDERVRNLRPLYYSEQAAAPPPPAQQGSSSPPLTAERVDLGELERLSAAATPGEWRVSATHWGSIGIDSWVSQADWDGNRTVNGRPTLVIIDDMRDADKTPAHSDAAFIVALVKAFRSGHLVPASLAALGTGEGSGGAVLNATGEEMSPLSGASFGPGSCEPGPSVPASGFDPSRMREDIDGLIAIWSMRPAPGCEAGQAWEAGARQGWRWAIDRIVALAGEARRAETEGLGSRASDGEAGTPSPLPHPQAPNTLSEVEEARAHGAAVRARLEASR